MKTYKGTKTINAKPMNRLDYNTFRGWELPADENGNDEGYLVEYIDGGQANTGVYKGYVSWSPAEVFEKTYKEIINRLSPKVGDEVYKVTGDYTFEGIVVSKFFKVNTTLERFVVQDDRGALHIYGPNNLAIKEA